MLTRIRIEGYKSLASLDVKLSELSLLFGPNASGKSNFLDALQLLSNLVTSRTLKDAFDPPYRGKPLESFTFGPGGIKGAIAQERLCFTIEADVRLSQMTVDAVNRQIREMRRLSGTEERDGAKSMPAVRERDLRYRITVEMLPQSGILRVADEYLAALNENGAPSQRRRPFLERIDNRLHLRLEGQAHPLYFDLYLDHSVLSLPHYPPHYPHATALRKELESWLFFYFEPRERMRAANPVKEVRHIGLMGQELAAFLNTLRAIDPFHFRAVEKSLKAMIPTIEGIGVEVSSLGEVELTVIEGGVPVPARLLSEGTLRVLGLLALAGAKESPSLIGFEEPENGIHPRRVAAVAELLKTRASSGETQYIATTHSALLADLIPEENLFVCRRIAGRTDIAPFSSFGPSIKPGNSEQDLNDENELTVSDRILRGDFDA